PARRRPALHSLHNPAVSVNTEQAVRWAMELHPDDRPPDVATFREALEPNNNLLVRAEGETFVVQPIIRLPSLRAQVDRYLAAAGCGLLLLAFLLTLSPFTIH